MPTPPYIPIPYLNTSGEAVPRYGVLQLVLDVDTATNTTIWSVKAAKPSSVDGVFAIDSGKGATAAGGPGAYGIAYIPISHAMWVHFSGSAPSTAWETQVGPKEGEWYMTTEGSGYWYAGAYNSDAGLVLVMQIGGSKGAKIIEFEITSAECSGSGTGSGTAPSDTCTAMAIAINAYCGGSIPEGEFEVVDDEGCWLTGNAQLLVGLKGKAVSMEPPGGGACYWSIISLPCLGNNC